MLLQPRHLLLQRVGTPKSTLREIGPDSSLLPPNSRSPQDEIRRANKIAEICLTIEDLDIDGLQSLAINVDDDLFLEYLLNCIWNEIISYQTFSAKIFNSTKHNLEAQLREAKKCNTFNPDLMREAEARLNELVDFELKNEFDKFRKFWSS